MSAIDSITRSALFNMQLPLHYYVEALHYGLTCLHELNLDSLQVTKTVRLTSNAFSEITLPDDYENVVSVNAQMGQYLIPYLKNPILTPLPNLNGSTQIPYTPTKNTEVTETFWGYAYYYMNDYGERLGKKFGGNGSRGGGFKVIPERNVIFLGNLTPTGTTIVLDYLTKYKAVTTGDPITGYEYYVNSYAVECITAFIEWKMSRNTQRLVQQNFKDQYYNALRIFRARMSEITAAGIKDAINMKRYMAIK
jgi:hypothetical protein